MINIILEIYIYIYFEDKNDWIIPGDPANSKIESIVDVGQNPRPSTWPIILDTVHIRIDIFT